MRAMERFLEVVLFAFRTAVLRLRVLVLPRLLVLLRELDDEAENWLLKNVRQSLMNSCWLEIFPAG